MLRDSLEAIDRMMCESSLCRRSWSIEAHHTKTLTTSLGDVTFRKTLFLNRQTKECSYLLDHILGLEPNQRLTEDAVAQMLEEAVQISYQRVVQQVSRQTVKNKLHSLGFSTSSYIPEQKKMVDWLYIDAGENHVTLQFREKKADLTKAENGVKNNGLITKMVCVYEGKEGETFHGRCRVLTNRHCFCVVNSGNFRELVDKQKKEMPKWRNQAKVEEAAEYILFNWTAAKLRHKNGVLGAARKVT